AVEAVAEPAGIPHRTVIAIGLDDFAKVSCGAGDEVIVALSDGTTMTGGGRARKKSQHCWSSEAIAAPNDEPMSTLRIKPVMRDTPANDMPFISALRSQIESILLV